MVDQSLIQTEDFSIKDVREYCIRANAVNRVITPKKVLKALIHPKKTFGIVKYVLKMNYTSPNQVDQQVSDVDLQEKKR
ncbi:MAG: hypothetical protein P8Y70_19350 [Candidatus Lokiarchaeota archaeon]